MNCKESKILLDNDYHRIAHPEWKRIIDLKENFLVVEGENGFGVFHIGLNKLITTLDHKPFLYELSGPRFFLFKDSMYILYDSIGNPLTKVKAAGLARVGDFQAFFYYQNNLWKIMNYKGKILKTPEFDFFDQSKAPIGQFIARIKGEKKQNRYAWVYTKVKDQMIISSIKFLGEYKEQEPALNWPPNQPVEAKQNK